MSFRLLSVQQVTAWIYLFRVASFNVVGNRSCCCCCGDLCIVRLRVYSHANNQRFEISVKVAHSPVGTVFDWRAERLDTRTKLLSSSSLQIFIMLQKFSRLPDFLVPLHMLSRVPASVAGCASQLPTDMHFAFGPNGSRAAWRCFCRGIVANNCVAPPRHIIPAYDVKIRLMQCEVSDLIEDGEKDTFLIL